MKRHACVLGLAALALSAALWAGPAVAGTVLWGEDFQDAAGGGAFDPAFTHVVGAHPDDPGGSPVWEITDAGYESMVLGLQGTSDVVSLVLVEDQYISHASVSVYDAAGFGPSTVVFVGIDGTLTYEWAEESWQTFEADMSQIGAIQGVELYSWYGAYDDVQLVAAPEPATWGLLLSGAAALLGGRLRARARGRR